MHLNIDTDDLDSYAKEVLNKDPVMTARTLAVRLRNVVNGFNPRTGCARDFPLNYSDALASAVRVMLADRVLPLAAL
jgi:hypothetical protein